LNAERPPEELEALDAIKAAKAEIAKARKIAANAIAKATSPEEITAAMNAAKLVALKANAIFDMERDQLEEKATKSAARLEAKSEALTAEAAKDSDTRLQALIIEREISANKAAEAQAKAQEAIEIRLAAEAQ